MSEKNHLHLADLHGISRLAVDGTLALTDIVAATHHTIARAPRIVGAPPSGRPGGITGIVYAGIRGITRLVGATLDALLAPIVALAGERQSSAERDAVLAALNGVMGDMLVATGNPLALSMRLRVGGQPLELTGAALADALPRANGKIVLLAHGLCMNDRQWTRNEHDHGAQLARDLDYTPVYLSYNSGLHISTNGLAFANLIEALLNHWPTPVEELTIIGHSMGGLVARSACHYGAAAGHTWPRRLRKLVFLGTPHQGAPLERIGNWTHAALRVSPYSAAIAQVGALRSVGITDLRYGNVRDEDWSERDRFTHTGDRRHPTPLPHGVQCYAIAATTAKTAADLWQKLPGDGLVPLSSALGQSHDPRRNLDVPASRQWIGYGMHHLDLLDRADVYAQLRTWLAS